MTGPISHAQREALNAADDTGVIYSSVANPISVTTARALKARELVELEVWSTWGALRKERGRGWAAKLTEKGTALLAELKEETNG